MTTGATRIIALATEVPISLLNMPSYIGSSSRLDGRASSYPHRSHVFSFGGIAPPHERTAWESRGRDVG